MGEGVKAAATCTFIGECADKAKSDVCTSKGQTCVDPRPDVADDWMCHCVAPTTGLPSLRAAADCWTYECISACATCENDVCKAAGQKCVDPNTKEANNWECHCIAPQTGDVAVAAATTCRKEMGCVDYSEQPVCDEDPACEYNTDTSLCIAVGTLAPGNDATSSDTQAPSTATPGSTRAPGTDAPSQTLSPGTQVPSTTTPRTLIPSTYSPDDTVAPPGFTRAPVTDAPGQTLSPDTQIPSAVLTATPGDAMLNDTDAPAKGASNTSADTTVPDTAGSMSGSTAGAGEELDAASSGGGSGVGLIVGVVGGVLCLCLAVGGGLWYRHHARESTKVEDVHTLEHELTFDDTALYAFKDDELQATEEDEYVMM